MQRQPDDPGPEPCPRERIEWLLVFSPLLAAALFAAAMLIFAFSAAPCAYG